MAQESSEERETERRRDEALRRALAMPPKRHKGERDNAGDRAVEEPPKAEKSKR